MTPERVAEKILNGLDKQAFADWYNTGRFDSYISAEFPKGHPDEVKKEQILSDIVRLFRLDQE